MTQPDTTQSAAPAAPTDPRPAYAAATSWVTDLLSAVRSDQWDNRTPCTEFDVRTLASHLIGTARRAVALGSGADVFAVHPVADVFDAETYAATVAEAIDLWADDAKLTAPVTVPWGTVPGAGALWGYVNESLVHGWDLAVATGQNPEADPEIVAVTSEIAQRFIPAEIRAADEVPFAAVVTLRAEAGPTERLANWAGRLSDDWV
ncbi:TIGR03086 family metal-binding protein [Gordonia sp. NPDC003376]